MRRKILRTVGILSLSFVLGMGMAGCAGKGDGEPGTLDVQSVTLHDSDGIESNSESDSPNNQNDDGAGE